MAEFIIQHPILWEWLKGTGIGVILAVIVFLVIVYKYVGPQITKLQESVTASTMKVGELTGKSDALQEQLDTLKESLKKARGDLRDTTTTLRKQAADQQKAMSGSKATVDALIERATAASNDLVDKITATSGVDREKAIAALKVINENPNLSSRLDQLASLADRIERSRTPLVLRSFTFHIQMDGGADGIIGPPGTVNNHGSGGPDDGQTLNDTGTVVLSNDTINRGRGRDYDILYEKVLEPGEKPVYAWATIWTNEMVATPLPSVLDTKNHFLIFPNMRDIKLPFKNRDDQYRSTPELQVTFLVEKRVSTTEGSATK